MCPRRRWTWTGNDYRRDGERQLLFRTRFEHCVRQDLHDVRGSTPRKAGSIELRIPNRVFHRSCDAIGQTLYIKAIPFTIVGVATQGFHRIGGANHESIPLQARKLIPAFRHSAYDQSRTLDPKRGACKSMFRRGARNPGLAGGLPRIACGNAAMLLSARNAARERESSACRPAAAACGCSDSCL